MSEQQPSDDITVSAILTLSCHDHCGQTQFSYHCTEELSVSTAHQLQDGGITACIKRPFLVIAISLPKSLVTCMC